MLIRPTNIPKNSSPDDLLPDSQVRILRAVNGSLNWLSSQSRPDLSVPALASKHSRNRPSKTSVGQTKPRIEPNWKVSWIFFKPIDLDKLTVVCHSDAAWSNVGSHTQAGYVIAFTEISLQDGALATWCPATWRASV